MAGHMIHSDLEINYIENSPETTAAKYLRVLYGSIVIGIWINDGEILGQSIIQLWKEWVESKSSEKE